jgi:desulfoferrodoxin (superoxide reductase-like protein)
MEEHHIKYIEVTKQQEVTESLESLDQEDNPLPSSVPLTKSEVLY